MRIDQALHRACQRLNAKLRHQVQRLLDGVFRDELGDYPAHSWLRNPPGSKHDPYTGAEGALIYVKVGHVGAAFLTP